jgi:hypothetical protein
MPNRLKILFSLFEGLVKAPAGQMSLAAIAIVALLFLYDRFATIAYVDAKTNAQTELIKIMAQDSRETRRMMWDLATAQGVKTEGTKPPMLVELTAARGRAPRPAQQERLQGDS